MILSSLKNISTQELSSVLDVKGRENHISLEHCASALQTWKL